MNEEFKIQATGRTLEYDNGDNPVQFSLWKNSKRGELRFIDDHIEFIDWKIRQSEIIKVIVYDLDIIVPPLFVLRIITSERIYDLAISSFRNIKNYFIVPVYREHKSLVSKKQRYLIIGFLFLATIIYILLKRI
ncbi:MAG: hypothetical protein Q8L01_03625 [Candidatus Woesebacteria bacterium]|nr:hypothetical protein [Candidatus Woesebacteria bacterium]